MKVVFTILLFYHAIQVSSAFSFFEFLDKARNALTSFFGLNDVDTEERIKVFPTISTEHLRVRSSSRLHTPVLHLNPLPTSKPTPTTIPFSIFEPTQVITTSFELVSTRSVLLKDTERALSDVHSIVGHVEHAPNQTLSGLNLFELMDDARSAIMFFFGMNNFEPETEEMSNTKSPSLRSDRSIKVFPATSTEELRVHSSSALHTSVLYFNPLSTSKPTSSSKPFPTFKPFLKPKRAEAIKASVSIVSESVGLNKFAIALEDIEKALADAQILVGRVRHNEQRLHKLRDLIKIAVQRRSYQFARKAIGEALFTIEKIKEQRKAKERERRNELSSGMKFLGSVREDIGVSNFSNLLSMQGQVTLMFAIDDTGSMSEDIDAAKKIATHIIHKKRTESVDYILSPFNDPGTGPVTYCNRTEKEKFVEAIASLSVLSGGDCPELTFKGMIDAIDAGPHPHSVLYIFTDAGPKDATDENIMYVKETSRDQGHVINFFLGGKCSGGDLSSFYEIARATSGQVYNLHDHTELAKLEGLTDISLGGTAVIESVTHTKLSRKKRSFSKSSSPYTIPVDDSIDTLVISVTADQPSAGGNIWSVSLTSPTETTAGVTTTNLHQGTIYQISKPNAGIWNLNIQADSSVNYDFFVKGSSANNIDFKYYFVRTTVRRGIYTTIPIVLPLLGAEAETILTLGGVDHVDLQTLRAELVTLQGDVITMSRPVSLKSKDRKGIRHSFKFYPPNQIFKIKLKGRTKKGNSFERVSHSPIKPESLLVNVMFARNDYTISQGRTGYVIFMIENVGNDEVVDITSFGSLGTVERQSRAMSRIRKGRKTPFSVTFRGNTKAERGVTVTVVVSVKGRKSGSKSVMSVPLLVV